MSVISIIQKSKLEGAQRIEAEYYHPNYIRLMKQLKSVSHINLGKIAKVWDGLHASIDYDETSPIYCLSAQSVKDGFFDLSAKTMISPIQHQENLRTSIEDGDVIISSMGTIGFTSVAYPEMLPANSVRQVLIVRPHNQNNYLSYYLCAFLNSKYGLFQSLREATGNVQQHLFIDKVVNFKIPILKKYAEIGKLYKEAERKFLEAEALYTRAEKLLLAELGLLEWKPKHTRSFVRRYSEATQARRIDSDFFQPKYDEIISAVKKFQPLKLTSYAKPILKMAKFDAGEFYRYIEIGDINTGTSEVEFTLREAKDLPANAKIEVKGGELLVSKVRPTRGAVGIVPADCAENGVASGAFAVYEVESPMREFLQVFLRSIVGKMQLEKPSKGTSYPVIENADVNSVLIPTLNSSLIKEISDSVKQSHEARREANRLLQLAKRAVETAIEEDEAAGLRVIGAGELSDEGGRMKDEILF